MRTLLLALLLSACGIRSWDAGWLLKGKRAGGCDPHGVQGDSGRSPGQTCPQPRP